MSLILAGIDEAGYGPTLGPLCVGLAVFRIHDWTPGHPAPDLWSILGSAVTTEPRDKRRRVPIADSKALKLPNDALDRKTPVHPLIHLEHGVLAMLSTRTAPDHSSLPPDDTALLTALGADWPDAPWYRSPAATSLPLGVDPGTLAISIARLQDALHRAGVELLDLRVRVIDVPEFNEIVRCTGTKAETTAAALGEHLRLVWRQWGGDGAVLRVVADQLGGRTQYQGLLSRELPAIQVVQLAEDAARSRYALQEPQSQSPIPDPHRAIIQFMPEAETHHLPVALASMAAKLVRELAMTRLNRYWGHRLPELKPTAGYALDARRWLRDAHSVITDAESKLLVRTA